MNVRGKAKIGLIVLVMTVVTLVAGWLPGAASDARAAAGMTPGGYERAGASRAAITIRDRPFEAPFTVTNIKSETHVVKPTLKEYKAVFRVAVKLSSGIKINVYTSKLDKKSEPLDVDLEAFDVLMNKLIHLTAELDDNPAAAQFAEIRRQADRGRVELVWNLIVFSDERLCLADPCSAGANYEYVGLSRAWRERYLSVSNQIAIVFDEGSLGTEDYFRDQNPTHAKRLGPDDWIALVVAHEAAHALFGLTGLHGIVSKDEQHELIVQPLESMLYDHFVKLPKEARSNIRPLHVDWERTSHPSTY